MSMKTPQTPRRIYTRNDVVHACFEGRFFGPGAMETEMNTSGEITIEKMKSDGGRARVQVTQRRPGQSNLVEVWRTVKVPTKHRA